MIHKTTKNPSFLEMRYFLQDKNVENDSFMLELYDESLENFDISDLRTDDNKAREALITKVIKECQKNIWFFFREIVRIPCEVSGAYNCPEYSTRFVLNPMSMAMIYLYDNNQNFIATRHHEKQGSTTTLFLLNLYHMMFKSGIDISHVFNYIIDEYENMESPKEYKEELTVRFHDTMNQLSNNDISMSLYKLGPYEFCDSFIFSNDGDIKHFENVLKTRNMDCNSYLNYKNFIFINDYKPRYLIKLIHDCISNFTVNEDDNIFGVVDYWEGDKEKYQNPLIEVDDWFSSTCAHYMSITWTVNETPRIIFDYSFNREKIYILKVD